MITIYVTEKYKGYISKPIIEMNIVLYSDESSWEEDEK